MSEKNQDSNPGLFDSKAQHLASTLSFMVLEMPTGVPQLSLLLLHWLHCLHICPESLHTFLGFPRSNLGSPQPQPRFHGASKLLCVPASPPKFQNVSSCLPGREQSHQFVQDSRHFIILPHWIPHNILKRTQVYSYFTRNWGSKAWSDSHRSCSLFSGDSWTWPQELQFSQLLLGTRSVSDKQLLINSQWRHSLHHNCFHIY